METSERPMAPLDETAAAAINRVAMNRLEDKLESNTALLQQSIQNLSDKVGEMSDDLRKLREKKDESYEKLEGRLRSVEILAAQGLVERVRWLEHKVWMYSGAVAIASVLAGLVLRKFGV